ncbi:GNAT family N-acetyltransferase [Vogesella sp. LIG4]|uniref:GNAT family N-acetyltransferase n=1 Tax=Vogesella sp. LIG4 TaxID=1192162 RepID=UPI00081FBBB3|nr:GNAT family N-acetyltransferase [Vogesella sp. LIG4]SCK17172.1 Ribosomal protein S18 acetylase RimI [Vogesella sp. LIG4]
MLIRKMTEADFQRFWPVFQGVIAAQDSYAFAPDMTLQQGWQLWGELPLQTWVAEDDGELLGSYFLKANAAGPGSHVANCGYMVSPAARGRGIAAAMCEHSQQQAREAGFLAMQFNSVVASNKVAVALWQKLGFAIVGRVPLAYRHRELGLVDILVMHKQLG